MSVPGADILGWTPNDYAALVAMAERQGAPPDWFAAVMMSESSMRPWAKNPNGGAQGLIQFANLSEDITGWTPAEQMPLIERFYSPWRPAGGWESRAQIYQANYLPATIGKLGSSPDTVIARRGDGLYQGAIFDRGNKGFTTVGDLEVRLAAVTHGAQWDAAVAGIEAAGGRIGGGASSLAKGAAIVVGLGVVVWTGWQLWQNYKA